MGRRKRKMKLWLLSYDKAIWEDDDGFVIRAGTEESARKIACEKATIGYPIPKEIWLDPAKTTCVEISTDGPEGIILTSNM